MDGLVKLSLQGNSIASIDLEAFRWYVCDRRLLCFTLAGFPAFFLILLSHHHPSSTPTPVWHGSSELMFSTSLQDPVSNVEHQSQSVG